MASTVFIPLDDDHESRYGELQIEVYQEEVKIFMAREIATELSCVSFLRNRCVLPAFVSCPGKRKALVKCGSRMKQNIRSRNDRMQVYWRCTNYKCNTTRSVRGSSSFLTFMDRTLKCRSSLSLSKILEMLYLFIHTRCTIDMAVRMTGCARKTVCDWWNLFREVCTIALTHELLLVGTASDPVQIDESYFQGKRKYHRGRLLSYEQTSNGHSHGGRNHGSRIEGPWVVGLCQGMNKVRFFVVKDRKAETLTSIILGVVQPGSVIVTDEWKGYAHLTRAGFQHYTVNHSKNFVDPTTGYHTQNIERHWVDSKAWLKRARRPSHLMQSHLDEVSYRKLRRDAKYSLLTEFLIDVGKYYREDLI